MPTRGASTSSSANSSSARLRDRLRHAGAGCVTALVPAHPAMSRRSCLPSNGSRPRQHTRRLGRLPARRPAPSRRARARRRSPPRRRVPRAGVEDLHAGRHLVEPGDRVAGRRALGIAARGEHDAHRRALVPRGLGAGQAARLGRREQQLEQVASAAAAAPPGSPGRRSGTLNSSTLGPRGRASARRRGRRGTACRGARARPPRAGAPWRAAREQPVGVRDRREGAHAARVRAAVAVADALVVARRGERDARRPSHSASTDSSSPVEELLDDDRVSPKRRSTSMAWSAARASASSGAITTPLPAARPSALSTAG